MDENKKKLNAMIPLVMDMLDIDIDDVLFSDFLSDDQFGDVVTAVVAQGRVNMELQNTAIAVQSKHLILNKTQTRKTFEVERQSMTLSLADNNNENRLEEACIMRVAGLMPSLSKFENFRAYFRMDVSVYRDLLALIVGNTEISTAKLPLFTVTASTGRNEIACERQLLIALEYLGSNLQVSEIAEKYHIEENITSQTISKMVSCIYKLMHLFISWPKQGEDLNSSQNVTHDSEDNNQPSGFSKCVGVIDVCHINIESPSVHESFYYINKVGNPSVSLQAVCDSKMNFIHCCTGWPGSVSDLKVLKDSDLFQDVQANRDKFFLKETYILGDVSYPLMDWLMTPFSSLDINLDPSGPEGPRMKYNYLHSHAHSVISVAFQRLKLRFPRLNYLNCCKMEEVVKIVLVCCALHNFCQNCGDIMTDEADCTDIETLHMFDTLADFDEYTMSTQSSVSKREEIATQLNETTAIIYSQEHSLFVSKI